MWVGAPWSSGHAFRRCSSSNATWWERFNTDLRRLERDFERLFCPQRKNNSAGSLFKSNCSPDRKAGVGRFWKSPPLHSLTALSVQSKPGYVWNKPLTTSKSTSTYTFSGGGALKPVIRNKGQDSMDHANRDDSFWAVSPRRRSWCFTREKWQKQPCEGKTRELEREVRTPPTFTQLLHEEGTPAGFTMPMIPRALGVKHAGSRDVGERSQLRKMN